MNELEGKPVEYDATGRMIKSWEKSVPVPKRKPTTGIEPPAYRRDVFKGERRVEWDDWSRHVQMDSTLSNAEKKAFHDIFAAEGGMRRAPNGTAVAGILQGTLDMLKNDKNIDRVPSITRKHGKDATTDMLDYEDVKHAYKGLFDVHFDKVAEKKKKNGSRLLSEFGDDSVASAFGDVVFRDGLGDAGVFVHRALEKANPSLSFGNDTVLGSNAFGHLKDISGDESKRKIFLNSLANQRRKEEKDRNDYFRFNE